MVEKTSNSSTGDEIKLTPVETRAVENVKDSSKRLHIKQELSSSSVDNDGSPSSFDSVKCERICGHANGKPRNEAAERKKSPDDGAGSKMFKHADKFREVDREMFWMWPGKYEMMTFTLYQ